MKVIGLILALSLMFACQRQTQRQGPDYQVGPATQHEALRFAIHPLHNPTKLSTAYQPLMDHLERSIPGTHLDLETSRNYAEFEAKIRAREPALLLPNPWQTLQAMKAGYEVIATAGDPEDFKGLILVRVDSGITTLPQLRGKIISYPSPTALAACIMPQALFHAQGIDVNRELTHHYVGSQESSIMNVVLKLSAAGSTWPPPWRAFQKSNPREAAQLRVLAETPPLMNNSVMVRTDLAPALRQQIRDQLIHLHESPAGIKILEGMETRRFHPATDQDYEGVRRYIDRFEREVRPVIQP